MINIHFQIIFKRPYAARFFLDLHDLKDESVQKYIRSSEKSFGVCRIFYECRNFYENFEFVILIEKSTFSDDSQMSMCCSVLVGMI